MNNNLINIFKDKMETLGMLVVIIGFQILNFIVVFNILTNYNLITKIIFSISSYITIVNVGLFIFLYKKDNKLAKHHLYKVIIYSIICIISFVFEL